MGFHICEYCTRQSKHPAMSSGDVILFFPYLGRTWKMPDMIVHYVQVHHYLPPQDFIDDVMQSVHIGRSGTQANAQPVGYLSGDYPQGQVPDGFLDKLENFLAQARAQGDRWQTRGI